MFSKQINPIVILLLVAMASGPSLADRRARIDSVIHSGTGQLRAGDVLEVILTGDRGGRARFEILGAIKSVALTETQPGRYETRYVIPQGLTVDKGVLVGYLKIGNREVAQEASRTVTVVAGSGNSTANNSGFEVNPGPDETVAESQPRVRVRFPGDIRKDSQRFYVDGIDFSRAAHMRREALVWKPDYDLSPGRHQAEVSGTGTNGQNYSYSWYFTTGSSSAGQTSITMVPNNGEVVTSSRPRIGADFRQRISRAQLIIDGRDFTSQSAISAQAIYWNPGYDLAPGQHQVDAIGFASNGQLRQQWSFTINASANSITNLNFSPTAVNPGQTVTVSYNAPSGSRAYFDLGSATNNPMRETSTGYFTGTYTVPSNLNGNVTVAGRAVLTNGQTISANAPNQLVVNGSTLTVSNIRAGMTLPVNFNVQGTGRPGSQVQVVVRYSKNDVLGALAGATAQFTATGMVSASGHFDIGVEASRVPRNGKMLLVITDNASSSPIELQVTRQ
ncbi:MAG: hypothetical protein KC910_03315 [Candidatus Eremiobacteraeota bacterium]|nr:hypothetical protein [Candidatus Eremiobacteraeota bacterium]